MQNPDNIMQNAVAAFGAVQNIAKIRLLTYQNGEMAHVGLNALLADINKKITAIEARLTKLEHPSPPAPHDIKQTPLSKKGI